MRFSKHHHPGGFIIVESLVAFAILGTVTVLVLANMHRMDENLARVRCEAHLGMIVNQYSELFRAVPWDALDDAANSPTSSGYILFGGGTQGGLEIPYRVSVEIVHAGAPLNPNSQTAQVVVDVFWSPPDVSQEQGLMPGPGDEVEFRRVVINRTRF